MTVGLRQTKKFLAGHKLLLTLRARDIFKISHSSSLQIGVLEWRSTGVLGFFLTHYSITPVLHYSAPPHPHGSTGICLRLFRRPVSPAPAARIQLWVSHAFARVGNKQLRRCEPPRQKFVPDGDGWPSKKSPAATQHAGHRRLRYDKRGWEIAAPSQTLLPAR